MRSRNIQEFCPLWGEWEAEATLGGYSNDSVWRMRREDVKGKVDYCAVRHIYFNVDLSAEPLSKHVYEKLVQRLTKHVEEMCSLQGQVNTVSYKQFLIVNNQNEVNIFLRMELLTPLTSRIKEKMTRKDVLLVGRDIATAIDILYAHQQKYYIKPSNIFLDNTGGYQLGNYGIREIEEMRLGFEPDGPEMMWEPSMEYLPKMVGTDIQKGIYSLGLVLYQLLNRNRLPFLPLTGNISNEEIRDATFMLWRGAKIPPPIYADKELSRIILKACAYDPKDRYYSGSELKEDLIEYLKHKCSMTQQSQKETVSDINNYIFVRSEGKQEERDKTSRSIPGINSQKLNRDRRYIRTIETQEGEKQKAQEKLTETEKIKEEALEEKTTLAISSAEVSICEEYGFGSPPNARKDLQCGEDIPDLALTESESDEEIHFSLVSPDDDYTYSIPKGETVIGRAADMDEYLRKKRGVSRRHAILISISNKIYIENISRTNFTYINNEKIVDGLFELHDGDIIGLGGNGKDGRRPDEAAYFFLRIRSWTEQGR